MSGKTCRIGEDIVVNVGVFHRRVGILPESVEEETYAEKDGGGENQKGAGEEL